MGERIGHVWRVRPGKASEYLRAHRTIWPELADALRRAGVHTYTIYICGDLVFSHMEVDDFARMIDVIAHEPIAAKWEEQFEAILEYPNADIAGWPQRGIEVWDLETDNPV